MSESSAAFDRVLGEMARTNLGAKMGKAAENERIKLKATFYNNIAIAFVIAGIVVPASLVAPKAIEFGGWLRTWWEGGAQMVTAPTIRLVAIIFGTIGLSICGAVYFRSLADSTIEKVLD